VRSPRAVLRTRASAQTALPFTLLLLLLLLTPPPSPSYNSRFFSSFVSRPGLPTTRLARGCVAERQKKNRTRSCHLLALTEIGSPYFWHILHSLTIIYFKLNVFPVLPRYCTVRYSEGMVLYSGMKSAIFYRFYRGCRFPRKEAHFCRQLTTYSRESGHTAISLDTAEPLKELIAK
jgi:hypothetical protein